MRYPAILLLAGCVVALTGAVPLTAGDKTDNVMTVVDANGKEHKVTTWKFTAGTRHLTWLAPPGEDETPKDKGGGGKGKGKNSAGAQVGPLALEFTEGKGAPLVKRILTCIPLGSIRSIEYDAQKKTCTVRVATSAKESLDEVLQGITGYVGCNIVSIEATADLGELGQATVKYQGGVTNGIKAVRFSAPQPLEAAKGRAAVIKSASKAQDVFASVDPQALYRRATGREEMSPVLYFKETVKLDLVKVEKLVQTGADGSTFDVTLKDGKQYPLLLIDRPKGADGAELQLEGLVARFAGGWRIFPMHAVGELTFEPKGKLDAE